MISQSRQRRLTRVRSIIAYMVVEYGEATLSDYVRIARRDLSTLSIAVSQFRQGLERDVEIRERIKNMIEQLDKQIIK